MSHKFGAKLVDRGGVTSLKHPVHYLYRIWANIMERCYKKNDQAWNYYGGRGISVHEPWHNPSVFISDILGTIGHKPGRKYSLDRYPDNDGNYGPGNVRWATSRQQNGNTRRNRWLSANGERFILADWARLFGIEAWELRTFLESHGDIETAIRHFGIHNNPDWLDPEEIAEAPELEAFDPVDLPQDYCDRELDCFLNRKGFRPGEVCL